VELLKNEIKGYWRKMRKIIEFRGKYKKEFRNKKSINSYSGTQMGYY